MALARTAADQGRLPTLWGALGRATGVVRVSIAVLACLVIASSLGVIGKLVLDPNGAEEYTVGRRPTLFYRVFDNEQRMYLDTTYGEVLGSAHNSGGSVEATLEAIIVGADVIEVDVVELDGRLYAAHTPPLPYIGQRFFRGPTLERIWTASYRADAFKLDLKESSPEYVELVVEFLTTRPIEREIIVASRSPQVLATLRERAPNATLLLSVPDEDTFARLQASDALRQTLDGVTVRESLIDAETATWLTDHGLIFFAWTVNDIDRVNELIGLGVSGITTDNLAILTLLDEPA
ncbi:MAG TPA: glycerophosphodiester phosphodiesterase [Thermomicrobiales bacterium]|nr:glycerophosphodiester phosphodiesterase [Thermomicrobiales bacterium]